MIKMNEDVTLNEITDLLSTLENYLEIFMPEGREKENALSRLAETVFWVTYGDEEQ